MAQGVAGLSHALDHAVHGAATLLRGSLLDLGNQGLVLSPELLEDGHELGHRLGQAVAVDGAHAFRFNGTRMQEYVEDHARALIVAGRC
ncbi:hypothetical protein [Streptomyces parvus]|uniref:hypothetical protein n=1 Tax=Streptomyces parvus TaxID=66428 RepID=UPI0033C04CFD